MSRVVAIQQPEHAPWIGFFNKMAQTDLFIYLDHVQFKKRYFENRNRIKTSHGSQWITVPVQTKGSYLQTIGDVRIDNTARWIAKYKGALTHAYGRAPFWHDVREITWPALNEYTEVLVDLNLALIDSMTSYLNVDVCVARSSEMSLDAQTGSDLILAMCEAVGADVYISGPHGRSYLDRQMFHRRNIDVVYHDFNHPEYPQRCGAFMSHMSTLDLIANCGPESGDIVRGLRPAEAC